MKLGWVYHADFLKHDTGEMHPEHPQRLQTIHDALQAAGLIAQMEAISFAAATPEIVSEVHDPAYVDLLRLVCEQGITFIGSRETRICRQSYKIALLAVGGVLAACDAVMAGRVRRAFCAVRPPGHHAQRDCAMGFCLFNNIAIAAEHLIRRHGLKRVAIVDFDVHHGNGTQSAFEGRDDVLFISIHEHPESLFPGTGHENETGQGRGAGYTLNVTMAPGSNDEAYQKAFAEKILPPLRNYAPQFLLVSAGFDAVQEDYLAHINLHPESFSWITRDLVAVAEEFCAGRLVSVLEGGYKAESLASSVVAHVKAMMDGTPLSHGAIA